MSFKGKNKGDQIHFELEGWDDFLKQVKKLPDNMKRTEVNKVLKRSAKPTLAKAKQLAPEADRVINRTVQGKNGFRQYADTYRPGNLARSHVIRTTKKKITPNPRVWVGPLAGGKGRSQDNRKKRGYEFLDDGYYGFFLINGTKHIRPMKNWIWQAFRETKADEKTLKNLRKHLVKQANKLGLNAK